MKRLTIQEAEILAGKFRAMVGLNLTEPVSVKTILRKLQILTIYKPLSENSYGISCKSNNGKMFMMVNSNSTRGRQHFTIGHELYHLFYDENPSPHMCSGGTSSGSEKDANLFAQALLMPREGIYSMISLEEIRNEEIKLTTILRLEQLFEVSRQSLLIRLKGLGLITEKIIDAFNANVKNTALAYGYDLSLYEKGNDGVVLGDFGEKARILFERGVISEGHYNELLNMISNGKKAD